MMHDVVRYGTAARAMSLGRKDLAGKTGTTNDLVDAWFAGYQPTLTAVAWIGFDQPHKLGNHETGSAAALPIWMSYAAKALKGVAEMYQEVPEGIAKVNVSTDTGQSGSEGRTISEYFYRENIPAAPKREPPPEEGAITPEEVKRELY